MAAISGVMPTVRGEIRQSTTWSIVLSVLMMVSGVLAIAMPPIAGLTVTVMFGWLLIVTGALHLGFAWRGHGAATVVGEILVAVLYAVIGFYMLARPVAGLASLTLAIAAYLAREGRARGDDRVQVPADAGKRLAVVRRHSHDRDRCDDRERMAGERRLGGWNVGRRRDGLQRVRAVDGVDRRASTGRVAVDARPNATSAAVQNRRARPSVSRCAGGASSRRATSV